MRISAFAAAVLLTTAGCLGDAPHDNPLDPRSDAFEDEGALTGQITTRAAAPVTEAEVRLVPPASVVLPALVTRTDAQGRFRFTGAPRADGYRVEVVRDGFAPEAMTSVSVRAGRTEELGPVVLNALPVFTTVQLRTLHISRWWPENDLFFLDLDATLDDADGLNDVDAVRFALPGLGFAVTLENRGDGRYARTVEADSLPARSLQALVGAELRLTAEDRMGGTATAAPALTRVIETTPVASAPQGLALTESARPVLQWEPAAVSFAFTYRIDVFRDDANRAVRVATLDGLPAAATEVQLPDPLPTGTYFWTVSLVDAFGNRSRSKEAGFRIP